MSRTELFLIEKCSYFSVKLHEGLSLFTKPRQLNIPSWSSVFIYYQYHIYDSKLKPLQSFKGLLVGKCNCRRKSMQEKESIMVLRCKLKIPSLGAHTFFVLFDVTCSPYGINRIDQWSNIWTSGPPPPPAQTLPPFMLLKFLLQY